MLDENEFKPFTLNDFSNNEAKSENTDGTSTENQEISSESIDKQVSDRISSFEPLTFEEEVSED